MSVREAGRISRVTVTPVAFRDPPLLNVVGVHQPYVLRTIVQVHTDEGLVGLGETYADQGHVRRLEAVAAALPGADVFDQHALRRIVSETLGAATGGAGASFGGMLEVSSAVDTVVSPFEVALLDLQGKALGRPVSDLLGGAVRDRVPYSAYLFYKWAGHPGHDEDTWGEGRTPEQLVAQARRMVSEYGFTAIKLKGGVYEPRHELETVEALAAAFPDHALRIDPNGAWTVETSIKVADRLSGVLEYLEDPTPGIPGMAEVAKHTSLPLATNMCVIAFEHLKPAVAADAVQVVLSDHHLWGGLRRSALLGGICETFGMGLSMHSNSHLGVSLAAMTHLAAATPNLTYACDTHYPWKTEEVIKPGALQFTDGAVTVPTGPGLGVELDEDALAMLHEQYVRCGQRGREDTAYMRTIVPDFTPNTARW
ncbi:Glucarate dehydratase [[Actinomadura] parvosata subsp. kistnae]|uniref:glucarate dehydratase n=1 Tax=[Actinomadura] parvosata subsp. kistnae TaxID=1909395 RepID=A0A1V0A350_9ACTN|nr:glucarate dehydratase family protein [Nonomuraea sp. ATCC 55076]AQZ64633.1 glucarate dehydratase [Nonomuraea sp. ATCC 55076]SPL99528.1 Glucarate dehydratase [Actinomadura parvosata subsp. kistnae]